MAKTFGGIMRRKSTIIGACSLAVITIGIGTTAFGGDSEKKEAPANVETQVAEEAETQEEKPVALGVTDISSVGASTIIDTVDTTNEHVNQFTGDINYFNVGFAEVLEEYHDYIYDDATTSEELHDYIKDMDIATQIVPEGSVIEGYTNLGISDATSYLNVRKGPGTSYKIVGKMPGYSVCEILGEEDGWYKIKSGNVTGYVTSEYLLTGYDANVKAQEKMTEVLVVNCDKLNVREEPSTECGISTKVSEGEQLEIVEDEKDGWYKASINGLEGYVFAEYVDVAYTLPTAIEIKEVVVTSSSKPNQSGQSYSNLDSNVSQKAVDLINTAYKYLGNPYVYGGNSLTNGIDCSGFVKQIFGMYGYSLPRSSKQYVSVGTQVPMSQIKPGDILIYKYGSSIGHVAIYIGNGKIIHAANPSKGICIGNYDFVYPYMAVRVIP